VNRALRTPSASVRPIARVVPAQVAPGVAAAAAAAGSEAPPSDRVPPHRSALARFFGVALEPRTYGALFYMLLSLATGIFFFTWVITGLSLSLGLLILIIGIPLTVLFFGSVRGLALLEGRLVEVLLGERMPRRPRYADRSRSWLQRIGDMFTDGRTWLTMLYFMLMLPLGIIYFTVAVTLLTVSLVFIWAPVASMFALGAPSLYFESELVVLPLWATPALAVLGVVILFCTMHLARIIGHLHGQMAKHLLVRL